MHITFVLKRQQESYLAIAFDRAHFKHLLHSLAFCRSSQVLNKNKIYILLWTKHKYLSQLFTHTNIKLNSDTAHTHISWQRK